MTKEKDLEKEPKKEEEKVEAPERTETEDGGIEVTLEEKKEETTEEPKQEEKKEEKPVDAETKLRNQLGYMQRKMAKLEQEIQASPEKTPVKEEVPAPTDEIDKLAQTDWKAAVRKIGAEEAKKIIKENQVKINEQAQLTETTLAIEKNAQAALEAHPELKDETSEKSQIWFSVLNVNPRWRNSPDGPLLVRREMEDELRKRGYEIDVPKKEVEKDRFVRANASTLPPSRKTDTSKKITLTKEQREFCDINDMKYEDYARNLAKAGEPEGVQI